MFIVVLACVLLLSFALAKGWFGIPGRKSVAVLWGSMFGAFVLFLLKTGNREYMMARINYYLNYANNPAGGRYVTALMKEGLANVPILNPAGEWLHLWDDSHTEAAMSFYLILKEPGVLPTIILMAGMVALFVCMASGVSKQKNVPGSLLGMACVMGLVIPAAGYVLTNLTMIPYTDFYIPFLGGQCGKLYAAWPVFIRVPVHRCGGVINTVINTGAMA